MRAIKREIARMRKKSAALTEELQKLEILLDAEEDIANNRDLVTVEELADILDKSVRTVRRWMFDGKLDPYYKKGRQYYWLRSELPLIMAGDD